MKGLQGKAAIVTGGGGAIGRAISRRLAAEKCCIGVFDRNAQSAAETVRLLREGGASATSHAVDVTDYHAVASAVADFEKQLQPADILVNNAGWDRFANFLDTEPSLWDEIIAVNLRGALNMHRVVLPGMVERQSGKVVNIASDAGRVGSSGEAVYAACKGGVVSFTKTLARELAGSKINLNAVCPGPTDTPLLHSFLGEGEQGRKVHEALKRAIPFRRLGMPEDVAGMVAFLASDEASFITGQVISVSGGLTMHG